MRLLLATVLLAATNFGSCLGRVLRCNDPYGREPVLMRIGKPQGPAYYSQQLVQNPASSEYPEIIVDPEEYPAAPQEYTEIIVDPQEYVLPREVPQMVVEDEYPVLVQEMPQSIVEDGKLETDQILVKPREIILALEENLPANGNNKETTIVGAGFGNSDADIDAKFNVQAEGSAKAFGQVEGNFDVNYDIKNQVFKLLGNAKTVGDADAKGSFNADASAHAKNTVLGTLLGLGRWALGNRSVQPPLTRNEIYLLNRFYKSLASLTNKYHSSQRSLNYGATPRHYIRRRYKQIATSPYNYRLKYQPSVQFSRPIMYGGLRMEPSIDYKLPWSYKQSFDKKKNWNKDWSFNYKW